MFEIKFGNKEFISLIGNISKVFMELPVEVNADGLFVKNISSTQEVAIAMTFGVNDFASFEYDGKGTTFTIPFGEFLDAIKEIKSPITLDDSKQDAITISNDKISFVIRKKKDDPDLPVKYNTICQKHKKDDRVMFKVSSKDFMSAVKLLSFSSGGVKMTVEDSVLTFESLKGYLTGTYKVNVDLPSDFVWSSSFNSEYMNMLRKIAEYSKEVTFYVKNPDTKYDNVPPTYVDIVVGQNSNVSVLMAGQRDISVPVVAQSEEILEEDNLEFEPEDFYEEVD